MFREIDSGHSGESESNSTDGEGEEKSEADFVQDASQVVSEGEEEEVEDIDGAFAHAKDCWKVDAETLKGFYLHSPTGQLFSWDQARGVLYEYLRGSGECRPIWAAGAPNLSSEIWTILPLPPTDPASLVSSGSSGNVLCILHLTRARATQRAALASADFCDRLRLGRKALDVLLSLPPAGQAYVLRTFCAPRVDAQGALVRQVEALKKLGHQAPYASALEYATVRVPASGAILGRCVPEIAALCWNDTDPVAAAHCRITCVSGQYSVCDLVHDEDGTHYDGRRLGTEWCPLKDGCYIEIGPIQMEVELKPVQSVSKGSLPREISSNDGGLNSDKKPVPKRGSWRSAKRTANAEESSEKWTKMAKTVPETEICEEHLRSRSPIRAPLSTASNHWTSREPEQPSEQPLEQPSELFDFTPLPESELLRLQKQRAHCPSVGGSGRAFWAIPRDPSPEKAGQSEQSEAAWIPRTPWVERNRGLCCLKLLKLRTFINVVVASASVLLLLPINWTVL